MEKYRETSSPFFQNVSSKLKKFNAPQSTWILFVNNAVFQYISFYQLMILDFTLWLKYTYIWGLHSQSDMAKKHLLRLM